MLFILNDSAPLPQDFMSARFMAGVVLAVAVWLIAAGILSPTRYVLAELLPALCPRIEIVCCVAPAVYPLLNNTYGCGYGYVYGVEPALVR